MSTEMLTYSRSKGVFAGLTLKGAVEEQDNDSTHAIYGKHMMFRSILSGKAATPSSANAFIKAVSEAGQQAKIAEAKEGTSNCIRKMSVIFVTGRNRAPVPVGATKLYDGLFLPTYFKSCRRWRI